MGATRDLGRLLRPRSIAVFGGKPAVQVIRQLDRAGYDGTIWPVHPDRAEIEGRAAYRSVADLPSAPDAAFLAINRYETIPVVAALAERRAGGAVAYASGFAEVGEEGTALQSRLIEAAGAMPLLGPNCYGFINYLDGALLWPDQHGGKRVARGVAIVTQSGNIGLNLTMQRRGLPIAYLVTLGNQAMVGLAEAIEAVLADERVTAIGLHIEGIGDPARFVAATAAARRRGVPIVALKAGRSDAGARLTVSHTASLAGADAVADAFLARAGVVRVDTIPVLLESLKLLHVAGPLAGRAIASMSCSGGEAALIADAAARSGLDLRPLDAAQAGRVAATLPPLVTVSNPLDYHTFSWGNEAALTETFAAMMAADYDMTMLVLDFPRPDRCDGRDWEVARRAMAAAARRTKRPAAIVATLPETMPEEQAEAMASDGIVALTGIEDALAAIEAGVRCGELAQQSDWTPALATSRRDAPRLLSEWQGKRALAGHGLAVPAGRLAASAAEAQLAAGDLGYPVVVKAVGSGIAHKTELGAVRLGLGDTDAVGEAAQALLGLGTGLLVERMVTDAVAELIVGIGSDPVFGLHLVIGAGGVLAELIADRRILMLPAGPDDIAATLSALRVSRLLNGYRGRPAGDRQAVVEAVMAIQSFALANAAGLIELDVNPLMVRPQGLGAVAVDALIRLGEG